MTKSIPGRNLWIQNRYRGERGQLRLFCFPYVGAGASIFRSWQQSLPAEIEVYPIQLPGRENRFAEAPFTELSALLDSLIPALLPYLDLPYAFFGHSMGALISFELARRLRQRNDIASPVRLLVSACCAPQLSSPTQPIHCLPDSAFVGELSRLKGTSREILQNSELLQILLPLLRADFALCEAYHYVYERPLACPLSVFGGLEDGKVPSDTLAAWCHQTTGVCRLHFFNGDHFFIHQVQSELLQTLSADLLGDL